MTPITQICRLTQKPFAIDDYDQAFYKKMGVPLPTLCPEERLRRRMTWRNERNLHYRRCDLCQKQIIAMYRKESPYTVFCNDCWWSDKWDPLSYGRDFDFNRPFFEQFYELQLVVPRLALYQKNNENCPFVNHVADSKNCHLCSDTSEGENIYYSKWMVKCRDGMDCYAVANSELTYEVQYSEPTYHLIFSFFANGCSNSAFLYSCLSCKNCFMCSNLVQKEYCIRNQYVGKEAYENFMKSIDLSSHKQLSKYKAEYEEMVKRAPKCESIQNQCENCSGDILDRCKNVFDSFETIYSQDSRYCAINQNLKDCFDVFESAFNCELQYECHGCNGAKNVRFSHVSYDNFDSDFLDSCHNSNSLFACIGMRRKQHCIFNKQYSKEDYEVLVKHLIEYMQKTSEWGEFFPSQYSPFAYNESTAQDHYPLSKEMAKERGLHWLETDEENAYQGPIHELPDSLEGTSSEVTQWILRCEVSKELYRITKQELELHKKLQVALPRRSPTQRFRDRLATHHPYFLRSDHCSNCQKSIFTALSPEETELLCKACYLQRFY